MSNKEYISIEPIKVLTPEELSEMVAKLIAQFGVKLWPSARHPSGLKRIRNWIAFVEKKPNVSHLLVKVEDLWGFKASKDLLAEIDRLNGELAEWKVRLDTRAEVCEQFREKLAMAEEALEFYSLNEKCPEEAEQVLAKIRGEKWPLTTALIGIIYG